MCQPIPDKSVHIARFTQGLSFSRSLGSRFVGLTIALAASFLTSPLYTGRPANCFLAFEPPRGPDPEQVWDERRPDAGRIACKDPVSALDAARLTEVECRVSQRTLRWLLENGDSKQLVFSPHALTLALALLAAGAGDSASAFDELFGASSEDIVHGVAAAELLHGWGLVPPHQGWRYEASVSFLSNTDTWSLSNLYFRLSRGLPVDVIEERHWKAHLRSLSLDESTAEHLARLRSVSTNHSPLVALLHVAALWRYAENPDQTAWSGNYHEDDQKRVLTGMTRITESYFEHYAQLGEILRVASEKAGRPWEPWPTEPAAVDPENAEYAVQIIAPPADQPRALPTLDYACPLPPSDPVTPRRGRVTQAAFRRSVVHHVPVAALLEASADVKQACVRGGFFGSAARVRDIVHPVSLSLDGLRINDPDKESPFSFGGRQRRGPFCSTQSFKRLSELRGRPLAPGEFAEIHVIEPPYAFLFYNAVTGAIYYWAWVTADD